MRSNSEAGSSPEEHRTIIFLAALFTLLLAAPAAYADGDNPYEGKDNLTYEYDSTQHVLTIGGTGPMTDYGGIDYTPWYSVHSSIERIVIKPGITSIGGWAFGECTALKSITIPDSVKTIGYAALFYCTKLESLTVPDSVVTMESNALHGCTGLTSLKLPATLKNMNDELIPSCPKMKVLTIPGSLTTVSDGSLGGCPNLTTVTLYPGVTSIGNNAFYGLDKLKSVSIPATVKVLDDSAFEDCSGLESISLPNGVETIGFPAFAGCKSLKSISLPNGVKEIGTEALYKCTSLKSLTTPSTTTTLGSGIVRGCTKMKSFKSPTLTWKLSKSVLKVSGSGKLNSGKLPSLANVKTVKISSGITSIADSTFGNNKKLTTVFIPKSVKSLGKVEGAFYGSKNLKQVYYGGSSRKLAAICENVEESGAADFDYGAVFHNARVTCNYELTKKKNPLKLKGKTVTVKASKLKKAGEQKLKRSKILALSTAKGTVKYYLESVNTSNYWKYFFLDAEGGKLTVSKGLKKGTYKLKIEVKVKGMKKYNPIIKTVTAKVKVK